jgi:hypothetical protein
MTVTLLDGTLVDPKFTTYRRVPSGLITDPKGFTPTGMVATGVFPGSERTFTTPLAVAGLVEQEGCCKKYTRVPAGLKTGLEMQLGLVSPGSTGMLKVELTVFVLVLITATLFPAVAVT